MTSNFLFFWTGVIPIVLCRYLSEWVILAQFWRWSYINPWLFHVMLSHFGRPEERMTILSETNIRVISQRLPGGFILAPSQGAVKLLHVLDCKIPLPAPLLPCLWEWKTFSCYGAMLSVWALFLICFLKEIHSHTFTNSCLYAWLWRSPLALVCRALLCDVIDRLPLLGTLQNTVFYSVFINPFLTQCPRYRHQ